VSRVLVVDDDANVRFTLKEVLLERGHEVVEAADGALALAVLAGGEPPDLVVSDLVMPNLDGLELLKRVRALDPELPLLLLTARGSERTAVAAMRAGAYDYLTKPCDIDELAAVVERALETAYLRKAERRARVERRLGAPIIGQSPEFLRVLAAAQRVAARDVTVLLRGETGTGKELFAALLHAESSRAKRPLVRFNCGAIPEALAEAELFGHARGAFTGASADRAGYFVQADGGTLVLDEIGELPLALQAKLLRALQQGEVQPVGAAQVRRVDVRVVACTHRDLAAEARAGRFRADVYYRLAVVELVVPPLRERRADIPELCEVFRRRYARRFGLVDMPLPAALVEAFSRHDWPGNVRELENTIAGLLALSVDGSLAPDAWTPARPLAAASDGLRERVATFERELIARALEEVSGNQSEAARRLKITRTTLIDKLKRHGLV
jgi:two-component system response regulator AtoC